MDEDANRSSSAAEIWEKRTAREEVLECPHFMALIGYISRAHDLPRYGWKNKSLRYHYTDAAGLLGIIETSRLWATDVRFLNDPSEGMFLPERLFKLMAQKAGGLTDKEREIIQGVRKALAEPRSTMSTFCVSLCADGDLLSQWRGYGSFGKGYAIGMDFGASMPHPQVAAYYDIRYGDTGLEEIAADLLDIFVSASEKWKDMMYDEWAASISFLAKSSKDESYAEERESRLVAHYDERFLDEAPLRFRTNGGDVIPYLPLALDLMRNPDTVPKLPMVRIVAGPGVEYERNYSSLTWLLEEKGYGNVEVVRSTVPFRA